MNREIRVFADAQALAVAAAERIVGLAHEAIGQRGAFHVALSGGSTPRMLYQRLAGQAVAPRIDWNKVHVYFGDERTVPPDHRDSNFCMAREAMLDTLPIPSQQIHRLPGEAENLERAAQDYSVMLGRQLPQHNGVPVFDLILLGMGDDGHTASLFPGTTALTENSRWVVPVFVEKLDTWRLTFTYPLINNAAHVLLLVAGASKAFRLQEIHGDSSFAETYPVQGIMPRGSLEWYLDEAAVALLAREGRA